MTSSEQRIVLVTGCSQGLGFHCVSSLASEGNIVVLLACRNVDNARTAATTIAQTTKCAPEHLVVLDQPLDLANNESVRLYAKAVRTWLGDRTLHSLVNNAGVGGLPEHRKNSAGHDHIFASNHLGHFLLTLLLLPVINGTGRIVNVSSEVHDPDTKTPLPDPQVQWPRSSEDYDTRLCAGEPLDGESARTSGGRRYTRSKLCNVLFTNELALRLSGATPFGTSEEVAAAALARKEKLSCRLPQARSIRVVAMNPGLMLDTGFISAIAGRLVAGIAYYVTPILRYTRLGKYLRSGPISGAVLAQLALSAEGNAAFYDGATVHPSSVVTEVQQELWAHSLRWAAVTPQELADAGF